MGIAGSWVASRLCLEIKSQNKHLFRAEFVIHGPEGTGTKPGTPLFEARKRLDKRSLPLQRSIAFQGSTHSMSRQQSRTDLAPPKELPAVSRAEESPRGRAGEFPSATPL